MSVIVKHKRGKKSKITVGTDPNQLNVGELFIETDEKKIYTNINNTMTSLTDGASATFSLDAPTADVGKEGDITLALAARFSKGVTAATTPPCTNSG